MLDDEIVSIFAICSARPITSDACERRGMVLYCSVPVGDLCVEPTHYLAVVGVSGVSTSDMVFTVFPSFGVFSYQWLTYYVRGGLDVRRSS